jgi:hypothetical protein
MLRPAVGRDPGRRPWLVDWLIGQVPNERKPEVQVEPKKNKKNNFSFQVRGPPGANSISQARVTGPCCCLTCQSWMPDLA